MVKASDFKDKETSHYFNPVILVDNLELLLVFKNLKQQTECNLQEVILLFGKWKSGSYMTSFADFGQ